MMLADLLTTLATQGALKPSRVPAMKTSIKSLAEALGHTSPGECPADWALREEATWGKALEDHWRTLETQGRPAGASMRRNTRNDIRKVFTLAEASGLLTAPLPTRLLPRLSTRQVFLRERSTTAPYKSTYNNQGARRYWLPQAQWPPDITEGFQAYRARCGGRLRETTFQTYVKCLATYLGYHAHIVGHPLTWDEVFDPAHVTAFMRWHAERLGRSSTAHGQLVAIKLTTMAQVLGYRQAEALGALRRELKPPAPLHAKRQHHWVDLDTLETVAETCLAEGRAPYNIQKATRFPGAQRAVGFQRGVLLKLLRRIHCARATYARCSSIGISGRSRRPGTGISPCRRRSQNRPPWPAGQQVRDQSLNLPPRVYPHPRGMAHRVPPQAAGRAGLPLCLPDPVRPPVHRAQHTPDTLGSRPAYGAALLSTLGQEHLGD